MEIENFSRCFTFVKLLGASTHSPGRVSQLFIKGADEKKKNLRNFPHFRVTFLLFFPVATRYIILNPFHAELIDVFPKKSHSVLFRQHTPHI